LDTNDNSDDFHIFRIAQEPNSDILSLWRDSVLLSSELTWTGVTFGSVVYIGDSSGTHTSDHDLDYVRLISGAFAPESSGVPGDANNDGYVDEADAQTLASYWGLTDAVGPAEGDFNADGKVNPADASILAANWNPAPSESMSAVPEPTCAMLLAMGLAMLAIRRRH